MGLASQRSTRQRPTGAGSRRRGKFDFTGRMRDLCSDMVGRVGALGHIELGRVAVSFSQTRKAVQHGMFASLTPMRFADGMTTTIRRGRKWQVQRFHSTDGREILYILNFYLPRFLDLRFREKLSTVIHELWHISPQMNGDIRRFPGRCFAHGASQKQYDAQVERLVDQWLAAEPPASVCEFLRYRFRELSDRYGGVVGHKIPTPKLIAVD